MDDNHIPVFDGHNDSLTSVLDADGNKRRSFLDRSATGHVDLPRLEEGGFIGGFFAIFAPAETRQERQPEFGLTIRENGYSVDYPRAIGKIYARSFTDKVIEQAQDIVAQSEERICLVKSYRDIEVNKNAGTISLLLHIEGAEAIEEDLANIEEYYKKGIRSIGLTWSRPNVFGFGVPFRFPGSPDTGPGLTEQGITLVKGCNRMGIMVDLSHLNEKGFRDVAKISSKPLIASHSNVHRLCRCSRNLTDAQIDAIGESKGLIGINFEPVQLRMEGMPDANMPLRRIVEHIRYVADRIGVGHVALGSDFDGATMPNSLKDASQIQNLVRELFRDGFSQPDVKKICYKNWLRVIKETIQ